MAPDSIGFSQRYRDTVTLYARLKPSADLAPDPLEFTTVHPVDEHSAWQYSISYILHPSFFQEFLEQYLLWGPDNVSQELPLEEFGVVNQFLYGYWDYMGYKLRVSLSIVALR